MEWNNNSTITVSPPKKPKKITGTRFAAIMGLNAWKTPFATWCEITRTYEEPFEDTIYTKAGKIIEPLQAAYMKNAYFMQNLISPTDVYGEDFFKKTFGDFFGDTPILGGMWDYLLRDEDGKPTAVLEMKTTKRSEDWENDIPEYYAMQAALYAYLLKVDSVIMVVSFLEDKDYEDPASFVPSASNTAVIPFSLRERYPHFDEIVNDALQWWSTHVETGISPEYDEKKDADILKELRKNNVNPETELAALIVEAESLQIKLDGLSKAFAADEKRLKTVKDQIKTMSVKQFRDGDKEVIIHGSTYDWVTSKTVSLKIDEDKMKEDGVLEKYKSKQVETLKLTPKIRRS